MNQVSDTILHSFTGMSKDLALFWLVHVPPSLFAHTKAKTWRLSRLSVGHASLVSRGCLEHECIWGSLCNLGRNTCTHKRTCMQMYSFTQAFVSMHNEACNLWDPLCVCVCAFLVYYSWCMWKSWRRRSLSFERRTENDSSVLKLDFGELLVAEHVKH